MPTKYLLTGVTGGLGAKILSDMLNTHNIPPQSIIATSRSASKGSHFESMGVQFRVADYNDPSTLATAFQDVENLLFMSSSTRDNAVRNREHRNVVEAAEKAKVGKVWYVSLDFGGFGDGSKIGFQQAHYETEGLLKESGLEFVSVRAGVYTDAFPLFLNWYPSSTSVLLPRVKPGVSESRIAWTSRVELGEAMATLLARGLKAFPSMKPKTEKNIILLTGLETASLTGLVDAINAARGTDIPVEILEPEEWIEACAKDDEGGKPRAWFEARLVFTQGVCDGDAAVTDPAMEMLLGRKPETGFSTSSRRRLRSCNRHGRRNARSWPCSRTWSRTDMRMCSGRGRRSRVLWMGCGLGRRVCWTGALLERREVWAGMRGVSTLRICGRVTVSEHSSGDDYTESMPI